MLVSSGWAAFQKQGWIHTPRDSHVKQRLRLDVGMHLPSFYESRNQNMITMLVCTCSYLMSLKIKTWSPIAYRWSILTWTNFYHDQTCTYIYKLVINASSEGDCIEKNYLENISLTKCDFNYSSAKISFFIFSLFIRFVSSSCGFSMGKVQISCHER